MKGIYKGINWQLKWNGSNWIFLLPQYHYNIQISKQGFGEEDAKQEIDSFLKNLS